MKWSLQALFGMSVFLVLFAVWNLFNPPFDVSSFENILVSSALIFNGIFMGSVMLRLLKEYKNDNS